MRECKRFTRFPIFAIHAQLSIFTNTRPKFIFIFPPHIDLQIHFHNIPMEKSNEKREDKNSIIRAETSGRRKFGEIKIVFARIECRQETDRMEAQS